MDDKISTSMSTAAPRLLQELHTLHHVPHRPSCLAYEPRQQLLAIGSKNGTVIILSQREMKRQLVHPEGEEVLKMAFGGEKGLLVTLCSSGVMYVWTFMGTHPRIVCRRDVVNEVSESYVLLVWPLGSDCVYIGTAVGEVRSICVMGPNLASSYDQPSSSSAAAAAAAASGGGGRSFTLPIYYRSGVFGGSAGRVVSIQPHPKEKAWLLLAYSHGLCVLWNLNCAVDNTEPQLTYTDKIGITLTSAWWIKEGELVIVAYSDGSLVTIDARTCKKKYSLNILNTPSPSRHHKNAGKSINRIQGIKFAHTQLILFTSNQQKQPSQQVIEGAEPALHLLSLWCWRGASKQELPRVRHLKLSSEIVDFICLVPRVGKEPNGLAVLTGDDDLLMLDVNMKELYRSTDTYITLPRTEPHSHTHTHPSITHVQCYDDSSDGFRALVQTLTQLKTAQQHHIELTQNKPWPLTGEQWRPRGVTVTGHVDGSVRLWLCYHESFVLTLTIPTSSYFALTHTSLNTDSDLLSVTFVKVHIAQQTILVCNKMGHLLLFRLAQDDNSVIKSQELILEEGEERLTREEEVCLPGYQFTAEENKDGEHCRLQLLQHFCCYRVTRNELMNANHRGRHSGPGACVKETGSHKLTWELVHVTTAKYIDEIEMLLVGTNHGLVVMDTRNNVVTQVMATDSKLLRVAEEGTNAHGKPGTTDCTITVIDVAYMKTNTQATPTSPVVWVGTKSGALCAFSVIISDSKDTRIQLSHSMMAVKHNAEIVNISFLDDDQLTQQELSLHPSPELSFASEWILIGAHLEETAVSSKKLSPNIKHKSQLGMSHAVLTTTSSVKVYRLLGETNESFLWELPLDDQDHNIINSSVVIINGVTQLVVWLSSGGVRVLTLPDLQLASSISSKHELSSTIFSLSSDRHGAFISADSQLRHFALNTLGVATESLATEGMAGEKKKS